MATGGIAIVTGGAGGLGQAFVARLRHLGYDVVAVDVEGTERRLDVTDPVACRELADELRPAVWINNAGVRGAGDLMSMDDERVQGIVAVNLLGVINGTRAAAGSMLVTGGGEILNVGSLSGWAPTPHLPVYSAAKHGVRALSVAADGELRGRGVRVRCLLPDGIRTPMVHIDDPSHVMSFTGKRLLEPDEVAAAGVGLLGSWRIVASVPPSRGLGVRILGIAPSLGHFVQGGVERRARRNQHRAVAEHRGRPIDG